MVQPDSVVVHPLVLLSVVDHYNRAAKVRILPNPPSQIYDRIICRSIDRSIDLSISQGGGGEWETGLDRNLKVFFFFFFFPF